MSVSSSPSDDGTILDRLNDDEEILTAMLSMPRHMNESMVRSRREELFEVLWEETRMDEDFVITHVRERENAFIEEYSEFLESNGGSIPRWLLRMEAQDTILQMLVEKMEV